MALSRALLLKGLAGVAAVGAVGGGVLLGKDMWSRNKEDRDKARKKINGRLETLGLEEDCRLGDTEDPYSINKECSLNLEKLKKIKFSNKGTGDLKVKGDVPQDLKLKIGGSNGDISFSFEGVTDSSPITIFGDKLRGKIVIKSESKFKDVDGQLTKGTPDEKLKKFNEQLGKVNVPDECRFDEGEGDDPIECSLTSDELKAIKFSDKEGALTVSGEVPDGLKLKAEKNQKNSEMSISFSGLSQDLTINPGQDQIVVNNDKKFRVEDDGNQGKAYIVVAPTLMEKLKEFNKQLETLKAPDGCKFKVDWTNEEDAEKSIECNITEDQFKALEFSNKGEEALKVDGWPSETVKLKVEKDAELPTKMLLSFPGLGATSSSPITIYGKWGKIVIKDKEQKFTVVDNKLTKESSNVDETLKKFNKQLGVVNAPVECRFDEEGTEESVECDVSESQLTTMAFYGGNNNKWKLTEGKNDLAGMRLKVQSREKVDSRTSGGEKELILTFKDYQKTVELKSDDGKKVGEEIIISLAKNTNPEFEIQGKDTDFKLSKIWAPRNFGNLLSLNCFIQVDGEIKEDECGFARGTKKIRVGKGTDDQFEELDIKNSEEKFELHEDVEDFNQGFKFVFKGETVKGSGGVSLEKEGSYEFRWKAQNKTRIGYLVKK